jgi:hypothetical protein
LKVGGIFVHKRPRPLGRLETPPCHGGHLMPSTTLPPDQHADIQALAKAIREATEAEIEKLAATLVATDDTHPFGPTEFKLRDLAHQIAAKALEQHLARKKTATTGPA